MATWKCLLGCLGLGDGGEGYLCSALCEFPGDGSSNATRTTCYDGNLANQSLGDRVRGGIHILRIQVSLEQFWVVRGKRKCVYNSSLSLCFIHFSTNCRIRLINNSLKYIGKKRACILISNFSRLDFNPDPESTKHIHNWQLSISEATGTSWFISLNSHNHCNILISNSSLHFVCCQSLKNQTQLRPWLTAQQSSRQRRLSTSLIN